MSKYMPCDVLDQTNVYRKFDHEFKFDIRDGLILLSTLQRLVSVWHGEELT